MGVAVATNIREELAPTAGMPASASVHQIDHKWEHKLRSAQSALCKLGIDGWLIAITGNNSIAQGFLGLDSNGHNSRTFFCLIPQQGMPTVVSSQVEPQIADALPGSWRAQEMAYSLYSDLCNALRPFVAGKKIAIDAPVHQTQFDRFPLVDCLGEGMVQLIGSFPNVTLTSSQNIVRELGLVTAHAHRNGIQKGLIGEADLTPHHVRLRRHLEIAQVALTHDLLDGWMVSTRSNRGVKEMFGLPAEFDDRDPVYCFFPKSGRPLIVIPRQCAWLAAQLPPEWLGGITLYSRWEECRASLAQVLDGKNRIAADYSPNREHFLLDRLTHGDAQLFRSVNCEMRLEPSHNIQQFVNGRWTQEQIEEVKHFTGPALDQVGRETFQFIRQELNAGRPVTEGDCKSFMVRRLTELGLDTHDPKEYPICAVNENAGNPHYNCPSHGGKQIAEGDVVLIDMWAKRAPQLSADPFHADVTFMGVVGSCIPPQVQHCYDRVSEAQSAAYRLIEHRLAQGTPLSGAEIDQAARQVLLRDDAYTQAHVLHDTGHSIGRTSHFCGVSPKSGEAVDRGVLARGMAITIEPGLYLPHVAIPGTAIAGFGVRKEITVVVGHDGKPYILAGRQEKLFCI